MCHHNTNIMIAVPADPCFFKLTTNQILWDKFFNAGQICITVDYVLVQWDFQDKLVTAFKETYIAIFFSLPRLAILISHPGHSSYNQFYPEGPTKSESFSQIVSDYHWTCLKGLLDRTKGTIVVSGESNTSTKYIAPTIVKDVKTNDSLMSEYVLYTIYILCTLLTNIYS